MSEVSRVSFSLNTFSLGNNMFNKQKEDKTQNPFAYASYDKVTLSIDSIEEYNKNIKNFTAVDDFNLNSSKTTILDEITNSKSKVEAKDLTEALVSNTFADGSKISVHALQEEEGKTNQTYYVNITKEDGSKEILQLSENTVFSTDENGKVIMREFEEGQIAVGTDTDDFVITIKEGDFIAGAGNDTIFNIAQGSNLMLGDGNNKIIGANDEVRFNVTAGNGDNTVESGYISGSFGDGDNNIDAKNVGTVTFGNGKNTILADFIDSLKMGDGDNNIKVEVTVEELILGDGDNKVYAWDSDVSEDKVAKSIGSISMGDGDNSVMSTIIGNIEAGDGKNDLKLQAFTGEMNLGDGDNDIFIEFFIPNASVNVGDGNNSIFIDQGKINAGKFNVGDGNNKVNLVEVMGDMSFGDGDNTIKSDDTRNLNLSLGDGNNSFEAADISNSTLTFGDGKNTASVASVDDLLNINNGSGTLDFEVKLSANGLNINNDGITQGNIQGSVTNSSLNLLNNSKLNIDGYVSSTNINMQGSENAIEATGVFSSNLQMAGLKNTLETTVLYESTVNAESFILNDSALVKSLVNEKEISNIESDFEIKKVNDMYETLIKNYTSKMTKFINDRYENNESLETQRGWAEIEAGNKSAITQILLGNRSV